MIKKHTIVRKIKETNIDNYFIVHHVEIETPYKKRATFYIKQTHPSSIIIPFLTDTICIMTRQHRVGADKISLEFPMGVVHGKTPLESARIELKEETGYSAQDFRLIGSFYPLPANDTSKVSLFTAKQLIQGPQELEGTEVIEVVPVEAAEIPHMIKQGIISDGISMAAWAVYSAYAAKLR